jgi:L-asparaginase
MTGRVLLLATGGTIAYGTRPERFASASELLAGAGAVGVDVIPVDVMAEPSWDLSPSTMLALARRTRDALLHDDVDGVVITHGTDTLEDTAFLVDLIAGDAAAMGGIVLTGAMRSLDERSADGPRNLAAALVAAADPKVRGLGAVACLNDELHAARWVTKVDATSVAAFSSAPHGPLARVVGDRVELLTPAPPRPPAAVGEPEPDIALIKTYPGIEAVLLTAVVDAGARGVVLEGTGAGNVPVTLFAAISDLIEWDIPVVVASRCRTRTVELDELGLDAGMTAGLGAIGARGLAPGKARGALMVAGAGVDAARAWFAAL